MDTKLVTMAQQGDQVAFAAINEASQQRLKNVAYRILRDHSRAEDATQQALVDIWQSLPRLRDPARFDAWSYRFVVRACHHEAKRLGRIPTAILHPQDVVARDDMSSIADRDLLERGFAGLSFDHRAVVVLHYYLDLTMEDTAEALGISLGTAKSRLSRAMAKLRAALTSGSPDVLRSNGEPTR